LAEQVIAEGGDLVLVLGGDGTINEVVQGMAHSRVPLGVLPGGTANCLAMELGLSSNLEHAAERLAKCEPTRIALGRVSGADIGERYFLLMCGAGLDAAIVYEVHEGFKSSAGKLAYWAAGLGQFRRQVAEMSIRLNGSPQNCGFVLVSRIRNYGGDLEIASGASLRRDDFEVVWFEGSNPLRYAWYMLGVGVRRVQQLRGVQTKRARWLEIVTSAPSQIDGEFFAREPLRVETVQDSLTLLMPPTYG
jgi:diacylglycerol kinase family enzyme